LVLAQQRDILAEQIDQPAGRPQRQEQQPQQRGLARAGRTGEELERVRRDHEGEVAQNLRAEPVAQTDIFEPNQCASSVREGLWPDTPYWRPDRPRTAQKACASVMVSDSLTVAR
ncbi:hypothetical protein chiPu_0033478, partial [Chiloscyllium punctatum]|nr:hypothetical protein [Chiloscyllium punctatum]